MKNLFIILAIVCCSFSVKGQNKKLVADETQLVQLKSSLKVITSNEAIFKAIVETFSSEGFKYTATQKRDRTGLYIEYSIPFKLVDAPKLNQFFDKLNKPKAK